MPAISRPCGAIAAVKAPVVRITPASFTNIGIVFLVRIADAMGPGVVPGYRHATRSAALSGQDQTVIAGRTPAVDSVHETIIFSGLRILETEPAALIRIGRRRAWVVRHTGQRAWTARQVDGRIDGLYRPQMSRVVSEITRRYQPVGADLFLEAEVPLGNPHVGAVIVPLPLRLRKAAMARHGQHFLRMAAGVGLHRGSLPTDPRN